MVGDGCDLDGASNFIMCGGALTSNLVGFDSASRKLTNNLEKDVYGREWVNETFQAHIDHTSCPGGVEAGEGDHTSGSHFVLLGKNYTRNEYRYNTRVLTHLI